MASRLSGARREPLSRRPLVFLLAGALAAVSVGAALGAKVSAEDTEQWLPKQPLVEGQKVFEEKHCISCHGLPLDAKAERIGPDLGRQSWQDAMQFAGDLWNHRPVMAQRMREKGIARPKLTPEEMGQLSAYLFYLRFLDESGDAARGRELFHERSCAQCHQLDGRGGTVGPRLDELKTSISSLFLAQALWNHGREMAAKMAALRVERPRLESQDVADIVAFIRDGAGEREASAMELAAIQAASPRVGKVLFREKGCIQCHAIDGAGGTVGPDLGKRGPARSVSEMAGALWNHGPAMWAKMQERHVQFPHLSDRDLPDLLSYLYFVQYTNSGGDAARGAEVFRAETCSQCHAVDGAIPPGGSDLAKSAALASPAHWAAAMWNHAAIDRAPGAERDAWPQFENDDMRDLLAYVRSGAAGK